MKRALKFDIDAGWLWAAFVVLLSALILRSFVEPLLWAAITAIATWPFYRRFTELLRASTTSSGVALLFTTLVSLLVLGPIVFALGAVVARVPSWVDQIAIANKTQFTAPTWLQTLPLIGGTLAERWQALFGVPDGLSHWLQSTDTTALLGQVQTLSQFMAHHLFIVVFTIFVLFFLYRGGDALALHLKRLVHDRLGEHMEPYIELGIVAVRATVNGMVVVALFDGVLIGVAYALAGVLHAEVWGAVTGMFAMIPFLGYVAVVGVALTLVAQGAETAALAVCGLGFGLLFAGDQIVRPLVVGGAARLGFVWVLMGSLGGFELLGLLGLLVGPVVLALAGALWHEWKGSRQLSRAPRTTPMVTDRA